MDDYQDQSTWCRVERWNESTGWEYVTDVDTQEQAYDLIARYAASGATCKYRTRRMRGLA